jgi:Recombination endonuclease VII
VPRAKSNLCQKCHKSPRHTTKTGRTSQFCLPCANQKARTRRQTHRDEVNDIVRRSYFKTIYGITPEDKERRFDSQDRKCAACRSSNVGVKYQKQNGRNPWHVDHNHQTKQTRGILCHPCNLAIGNARESVTRLRACADYLERSQ